MKKIFAGLALGFLFIPFAFAAIEVPAPPSGYVLDEAELLSVEVEQELETQLALLEQENSTEIAVVTVNSLQGYAIEEFTIELARSWGVGQEEFDNGLVLLVAPFEREVRIEVGYGLEGAVTDSQSASIINEVLIPFFKDGLYEDGIVSGVYYMELLARGEEFEVERSSHFSDEGFFFVLLVYVLPFFYLFIAMMSSSKAWWPGGLVGGFVGVLALQTVMAGVLGLLIGLFVDYVLSTFFFKKIKMPKGGSGFGGSGGSFGGGGGFGGGSFGGGGASGSW